MESIDLVYRVAMDFIVVKGEGAKYTILPEEKTKINEWRPKTEDMKRDEDLWLRLRYRERKSEKAIEVS